MIPKSSSGVKARILRRELSATLLPVVLPVLLREPTWRIPLVNICPSASAPRSFVFAEALRLYCLGYDVWCHVGVVNRSHEFRSFEGRESLPESASIFTAEPSVVFEVVCSSPTA